ncbi:MAG: hypothetical protein HND58_05465 [Planctomycetota bacterium]|nr:MAG: hypothetical protein HND58_05465 [Planctomycetota bacterium]
MTVSRLRHRVFMMAFIASPLVVMVVLVYAILIAFERGPSMVAEPVGARRRTDRRGQRHRPVTLRHRRLRRPRHPRRTHRPRRRTPRA